MQISMNWLKKYIDVEDTAEVLGEKLTLAGIPVENILPVPKEIAGVHEDFILEFELTANRGDCFSALGLLREIAVITGKKIHFPQCELLEDTHNSIENFLNAKIEAEDLCTRFSLRFLNEVKVFPSPTWLQNALTTAGIRTLNNVVDVTNYVMIELGQPLHAYDYDKITGHFLTVRRAKSGEKLHTLDDTTREATGEELVIADEKKVIGVAGVMGGKETEITTSTTKVVLEAAIFSSANVRRSAKELNIHSEASCRFERGVDIAGTLRALDRVAELLQEMGACKVAKGKIDILPQKVEPLYVTFSVKKINQRLGTNLDYQIIKDILMKLGFGIEQKGEDLFSAKIPSWRHDVSTMADLSEEVARIYGFDHIESTIPQGEIATSAQNEKEKFTEHVKNIFQRLGFMETISFSFMQPKMFDILEIEHDSELRRAIPILNPLSEDYPLVRTTLIGNILDSAVRNIAHKNEDLALFEIGRVFLPKTLPLADFPHEKLELVALMTGKREIMHWQNKNELFDFYDAKGVLEDFFVALGIEAKTLQVERGYYSFLHPGKTAVFKKAGKILAFVGELHPKVLDRLSLPKQLYLLQIDLELLLQELQKVKHYEPLPKYPKITRDLAILIDKKIVANAVEETIEENGGRHLKNISLFDVYEGERIDKDKKSLAFTLSFQSNERTLTDEEIRNDIEAIIKALAEKFVASLRK